MKQVKEGGPAHGAGLCTGLSNVSQSSLFTKNYQKEVVHGGVISWKSQHYNRRGILQ